MRVSASLCLALCLLASAASDAATYPSKPVRLIVAFPPGGNVDLVARLIAQKLGETYGRVFVIDNRGGAGGVVGEEVAARSAADGYTLLMVSLAHVVNPAMNRKLGYDPMKDLMPVSLVVSVPNALIVHKSLPVQSVPELISLARSRPGELNYASSYGTTLHLAGELFKVSTGVDIVNVNYKSGGLAVPDIEAGRVQLAFSVITTAMTILKKGNVRALAVTSAKRSAVMPELPAIAEFVTGYEVTGWQGVLAPAGTPAAIVSRLGQDIASVMRTSDIRAKLLGMGADPIGSTPEAFTAFRKAELTRLTKLVAKAGIKAEY